MMRSSLGTLIAISLYWPGWLCSDVVFSAEFSSQHLAFFEKQIRPLLAEHCYECHSHRAKRLEGGLYLDSRDGALTGGDSGPSIELGQPDESQLIQAIRYESFEMPPRGKLKASEIEALAKWVKLGAPWPDEPAPTATKQVEKFDWKARKAAHWAWQPIQKPVVPEITQHNLPAGWPQNEIDHFVLQKLANRKLNPSRMADRRTLARRLYFDLIGLPPTPRQLQEFLDDESSNSYENLVDELLASPHFGEKWARHWMDLVRYAETHGHEFDYPIHNAWKYRDYLIRAFNADVPYDQFVREHIAGDLLAKPRLHPTEKFNESVIGTGFWFLHEATHAPTDVRGDETLRVENQIDVFSKTFLGLTVACARCHDHKFDPIPTTDYYALAGFLQGTRKADAALDHHGQTANVVEKLKQLATAGEKWLTENDQWLGGINKPDEVARYLTAARDAWKQSDDKSGEMPADAAITTAADDANVPAETLKAWLRFLNPELAKDIAHPFSALANIVRSNDEQFKQHAERWKRNSIEITGRRPTRADTDLASAYWFLPNGWLSRQTAFWDLSGDRLRFVEPYVYHSGSLSNRLRKQLRTHTFELTHDKVQVRLNGRRVTVRLIIDGYQMEPFSSLLFGGTRVSNIDTKGKWQWITLNSSAYRGHKAYLEILDDGDGEFSAGSQVWLSNDGMLENYNSHFGGASYHLGPTKMAEELAEKWAKGVNNWRSTPQPSDHVIVQTINEMIEAGILNDSPLPLKPFWENRRKLESALPAPDLVLAAADGTAEDEHVFIRGSHTNLGDVVPRRFLIAIAGEDQNAVQGHTFRGPDGSGRLTLMRRLLDESNPFPARVLVNRLWHHLFGRGIVATVDDFGVLGQPPSHPELLDWLPNDFREKGSSIKHTIRKIVLSATYRQASHPQSGADAVDPDNRWLSRQNIRRLPAESIRDAILTVSGQLDSKQFGPSVPVHLTPFMQGRGRPGKSGPVNGHNRRSIYLEVRRNFLTPMLTTYDFPSPFSTMGHRTVSNVPAQALMLMNDEFVIEQSRHWAKRLLNENSTREERIQAAFQEAFSREATPTDLANISQFLEVQAKTHDPDADKLQVWTDLCHVLLNMKRFVYIH